MEQALGRIDEERLESFLVSLCYRNRTFKS